jgi:Transposase Tn5 dimerisation domain
VRRLDAIPPWPFPLRACTWGAWGCRCGSGRRSRWHRSATATPLQQQRVPGGWQGISWRARSRTRGPETLVVTVADRDGEMHTWFLEARQRLPGDRAEGLMRAHGHRRIANGHAPRSAWEARPQHRPPPQAPPSLRERVRDLAQLAGFFVRTGDGEPGLTSLWQGSQRLHGCISAVETQRTVNAL